MTNDQFLKVVEGQYKRCTNMLAVKAEHYAWGTEDRLAQFKRAAALLKQTPHEVCLAYMSKHTTKLVDMIYKYARGEEVPIDEWNEVITDHINYLILAKALVFEEECSFEEDTNGDQ